MSSTLSRTPPSAIRRKLREEVGFGCPVEGCGSPYLSYHHFDPPWNIQPHHNPEGMIALCLQHHKEADKGAFTPKQLREMKKHPYLKEIKRFPKGRFNWKREQFLLLVGGNWYIKPKVILKLKEKKIIWLSKDTDGFEQINLDIYDFQGNIILNMRNNDWLIHASIDDLECPPSGNSLKIKVKSHNVWINLSFSQFSKEELYKKVESLHQKAYRNMKKQKKTWPKNEWTQRILESVEFKDEQTRRTFGYICENIKEETITLCTLQGHLVWPVDISLNETCTILPGQNIITGCLMVNVGIGLKIA